MTLVAQGRETIVWIEFCFNIVSWTCCDCCPATNFATLLVASGFTDLQTERVLDVCNPRLSERQNCGFGNTSSATNPKNKLLPYAKLLQVLESTR